MTTRAGESRFFYIRRSSVVNNMPRPSLFTIKSATDKMLVRNVPKAEVANNNLCCSMGNGSFRMNEFLDVHLRLR